MLYLLLAIVTGAAMAIVLRIFRDPKGNRFGIILGNYLTAVVLALCFLPDKGQLARFSPKPFLGMLGGVFYVSSLIFMQRSIPKSGAAVTAAFSKLGLVISLIVAIAFLGERPTVPEIVGIVLALSAVVLMNLPEKKDRAPVSEGGVKKASGSAAVLLLLVWLTGGGGETMAKIFDYVGDENESALYLFILFSTAAVLAGVFAAVEYRRTKKPILLKELAAGVALGAPNYLSSYFLLRSLGSLPAVVSYPVYSGGVIVLVTLLSLLIFRERPTRLQWIGLAAVVVSLVLLNI